jgi:hypothetical protein
MFMGILVFTVVTFTVSALGIFLSNNLSNRSEAVFLRQKHFLHYRGSMGSFPGYVSIISESNQNTSLLPQQESCVVLKFPEGTRLKSVVLQHVIDTEPSFDLKYTKHGNPKPDTFDRADSLIIAKAGFTLTTAANKLNCINARKASNP